MLVVGLKVVMDVVMVLCFVKFWGDEMFVSCVFVVWRVMSGYVW